MSEDRIIDQSADYSIDINGKVVNKSSVKPPKISRRPYLAIYKLNDDELDQKINELISKRNELNEEIKKLKERLNNKTRISKKKK